MQTSTVFLVLAALCFLSFLAGRQRSRSVALASGGLTSLHSLPKHYGYMALAWAGLPALGVLVFWAVMEPRLLAAEVAAVLPADVLSLPEEQFGL